MKTYFKNIWLGFYTVLVGMKITWAHLFAQKVTNQYPDRYHPIQGHDITKKNKGVKKGDPDRSDIPLNSRNRIFVDMDLCNGCMQCTRACPVNCITVETVKVVPGDVAPDLSNGEKRSLWVTKYEIDFAKCCFCSLCTEPCPTEAVKMTREFEYAAYDRNSLIYQFSKLTPELAQEKKDMNAKFQEEKKKADAAKKAAAAAAAPPKAE
jgi:NADH-quinone oxidoreductase subunit I